MATDLGPCGNGINDSYHFMYSPNSGRISCENPNSTNWGWDNCQNNPPTTDGSQSYGLINSSGCTLMPNNAVVDPGLSQSGCPPGPAGTIVNTDNPYTRHSSSWTGCYDAATGGDCSADALKSDIGAYYCSWKKEPFGNVRRPRRRTHCCP